MANSTIDDQKIILYDLWPGDPVENLSEPLDGFTGSDHHNVVSPAYDIGTKIRVYDDTSKGYATFIYLQNIQGTAGAVAAKDPVCMDTSEQATAATSATWYKVGSDGGETLVNGPMAIAISAMTTAYYGWFWCGGVCPVSYVSGLGGNYVTDSSLTAGGMFTGADSTADGKIALTLAMTAAAHATSVADTPYVGMSLIADA
jgi:hypothetical protein